MDTRKLWSFVIVLVLVVLGSLWFFLGPTGKEAVQAIDHTADEVTGKRAVDQGVPLRQEVRAISTEQKDRLRGIGLDRGTQESR